MFADNRAYGGAGFDVSGAQILNRNYKKVEQSLKVCLISGRPIFSL